MDIAAHHIGLDLDGPLDQLPQLGRLRGLGLFRRCFDDAQNLLIGDEPAFDHLCQTCDQLIARQCGQRVQVSEHPGWLVEAAHQVLALSSVDAGLAADRGVDHSQQRSGHMHHSHPAKPGCGHKAGKVSHRAAADRDDGVRAGEVVLAEHLPAEGRHLDVFALLCVRDLSGDRLITGLLQVLADHITSGPQSAGVNDQHSLGLRADQFRELGQQTVADDDVVAEFLPAGPGSFTDSDHGGFCAHRCLLIASMMVSTRSSTVISAALTTRSAHCR